MKVKVIKCSRDSYWYADKIGQEFDYVESHTNDCSPQFTLIINYGSRAGNMFVGGDVEIVTEFDMKKEAWFIRVPTPEISKLVQEGLFEQGFTWSGQSTSYLTDVFSDYGEKAAIGHFGNNNQVGYAAGSWYEGAGDLKEIKFTFKTIIDSIEYLSVETDQQKAIRELEETIAKASEQIKQLKGEM